MKLQASQPLAGIKSENLKFEHHEALGAATARTAGMLLFDSLVHFKMRRQ